MAHAKDVRKVLDEYLSKTSRELTEYIYAAQERLAELRKKEPEVANALEMLVKHVKDGIRYENSPEREEIREAAMTTYDNLDEMKEMTEAVEAVFKKHGIKAKKLNETQKLCAEVAETVIAASKETSKEIKKAIGHGECAPAKPKKGVDAPIEDVVLHMFYENPDRRITSTDIAHFYKKTLSFNLTESAARDRLRKYVMKHPAHVKANKELVKGSVAKWVVTYNKDGSARPIETENEVVAEKKWKNKSVPVKDFYSKYGLPLAVEMCEKNPDKEFNAAEFAAYLKEVGVSITGTGDMRRTVRDFMSQKLAGSEKLEFKRVPVAGGSNTTPVIKLKGEKCVRIADYNVSENFLETARQYLKDGLVLEDWEILASLRLQKPITAKQLEEAKEEIMAYLNSKGTPADADEKGRIAAKEK
ncbi:MAG: hypothetical protein QXD77_00880 [Candidatus Aenigmatarchaeota archaeon]